MRNTAPKIRNSGLGDAESERLEEGKVKVYVLGSGEYENWGIDGVYASREPAERIIDLRWDEAHKQQPWCDSGASYYSEERFRAMFDIDEFVLQGLPDEEEG